jgi:hypothetical protein
MWNTEQHWEAHSEHWRGQHRGIRFECVWSHYAKRDELFGGQDGFWCLYLYIPIEGLMNPADLETLKIKPYDDGCFDPFDDINPSTYHCVHEHTVQIGPDYNHLWHHEQHQPWMEFRWKDCALEYLSWDAKRAIDNVHRRFQLKHWDQCKGWSDAEECAYKEKDRREVQALKSPEPQD